MTCYNLLNDDICMLYENNAAKDGKSKKVKVYFFEWNEVARKHWVLECHGLLDSFIECFNLPTGHTETEEREQNAQYPI